MAIRADSFSSTGEVRAYCRHLLDGADQFNTATRPTLTDVEKFIDRASGVLNLALAKSGLSPAGVRANSTAKLACDDWVTAKAVGYVETTQRGSGSSGEENERFKITGSLSGSANKFVKDNNLGFKRLGVTVSHATSEGLVFTGETAAADRTDPSDTSLRQPLFKRGQYDDSSIGDTDEEDD